MIETSRNVLRALMHCRRGATAMEYGLIVALISLVIIVAVTYAGTELGNFFNTLGNTLGAL